MALELLYDAIRITGNDNTLIQAEVKDEEGEPISTGIIKLEIPDLEISIRGVYDDEEEVWNFTLPQGLKKGRYYYYFSINEEIVDFQSPIYIK